MLYICKYTTARGAYRHRRGRGVLDAVDAAASGAIVAAGNFGDAKSVGGAVSELRIDHGPGYRVYYVRRGSTVVILLCGGHKRTQSRDIRKAREIAETLED